MPPTRVFLALSLIAASGLAQVRTWVSTGGLDSNPCTRAQPCRNFNVAIAAVADNGETVVLDSGGYGAATISKSVSIIAPEGIHAAIAPTTGPGIRITAGDRVEIRNLYVKNQGSLDNGIQVDSVGELFVEKTTIQGFDDAAGASSGIETQSFEALHLSEVVIRHCYEGASIFSAVNATVDVERSRFEQNMNNGFAIMGGVRDAIIQDSMFTRNGLGGLFADASSFAVYVAVERCTLAGNVRGIHTGASSPAADIEVSNSTIVSNTTSIVISGGDMINSRGNNTVRRNVNFNPFTNTFPGL